MRLNDDEYLRITASARELRATVASFMAAAALTAADGSDSKAAILDRRAAVHELLSARAQLGRVGNNLNQLAKIANTGGEVDGITELLAVVRRLADRLDDAARILLAVG